MTSWRRNVIKVLKFNIVKIFVLVQSMIIPNIVAISQILSELYGLHDYDLMTSRRRYIIEILYFDFAKKYFSWSKLLYIPPNFVAISQL